MYVLYVCTVSCVKGIRQFRTGTPRAAFHNPPQTVLMQGPYISEPERSLVIPQNIPRRALSPMNTIWIVLACWSLFGCGNSITCMFVQHIHFTQIIALNFHHLSGVADGILEDLNALM